MKQLQPAKQRQRCWWPLSHRSKIVVWAFVPASIILGLVALVAFLAYRQITAEMVMERDQQLVQVAAVQLAHDLEEQAEGLEQIARTLAVRQDVRTLTQLPPARTANALATFKGGIVFVDGDGIVVTSQPRRPTLVGEDWSRQPFIDAVRRGGTIAYSDLIVTLSGAEGPALYSAAVTAPVIGVENDYRGAVVGFYRLDEAGVQPFSAVGLHLPLHAERQVFLVDGQGRVLYHTQPPLIGADYSAAPSVQMMRAGNQGALRAVDRDDEVVVTAYAGIPGMQWGLVAEERWSTLMAPYAGYQNLLLFLLALGLVAPAAIVMVGVRRLMRPLQALTAATREVARGNFGGTIHINSGDEIETLANHFNLMSDELAFSYARLEERLAARTRELQALNAIAAVIGHAGALADVLRVALAETLAVMDMDAGAVYLLNETGGRQALAVQMGLEDGLVRAIDELPQEQGICGEPAALDEPVLAGTVDGDPRPARAAFAQSGFHALACIPIKASGRVFGTLFVVARRPRDFLPEDAVLLTSIGQQVGVAVENARLMKRVQASAVEEERQRLARELHDAVTQTLFSASLIAEVLPQLWEKDQALAQMRLAEMRDLSRGALAEMRALLLELRPTVLEKSPLPDLLRQLVEATRGRSRMAINLTVEGHPPADGLPAEVQIALYRIAQEALNNVVKHAEARRVEITLAFGAAGVLLSVCDDGKGFGPAVGEGTGHEVSFGLSIMRERVVKIGADLQIESGPGAGTEITVVVPAAALHRLPGEEE